MKTMDAAYSSQCQGHREAQLDLLNRHHYRPRPRRDVCQCSIRVLSLASKRRIRLAGVVEYEVLLLRAMSPIQATGVRMAIVIDTCISQCPHTSQLCGSESNTFECRRAVCKLRMVSCRQHQGSAGDQAATICDHLFDLWVRCQRKFDASPLT